MKMCLLQRCILKYHVLQVLVVGSLTPSRTFRPRYKPCNQFFISGLNPLKSGATAIASLKSLFAAICRAWASLRASICRASASSAPQSLSNFDRNTAEGRIPQE